MKSFSALRKGDLVINTYPGLYSHIALHRYPVGTVFVVEETTETNARPNKTVKIAITMEASQVWNKEYHKITRRQWMKHGFVWVDPNPLRRAAQLARAGITFAVARNPTAQEKP